MGIILLFTIVTVFMKNAGISGEGAEKALPKSRFHLQVVDVGQLLLSLHVNPGNSAGDPAGPSAAAVDDRSCPSRNMEPSVG